jgi:hypothetical protein
MLVKKIKLFFFYQICHDVSLRPERQIREPETSDAIQSFQFRNVGQGQSFGTKKSNFTEIGDF